MMFDKVTAKHYAPLAMIFATTSGMSRSDSAFNETSATSASRLHASFTLRQLSGEFLARLSDDLHGGGVGLPHEALLLL